MMFEHHTEPVIGRFAYSMRLLKHGGFAVALVLASLCVGVFGLMLTSSLTFIQAFVDACMLLGGMGPVNCGRSESVAGNIFASLYALFCGVIFIVAMGIMVAPVIHRFLHKFHFRTQESPMPGKGQDPASNPSEEE